MFKFLRSLHENQLQYCDADNCYFWYDPKRKEHIHPAIHKNKMIEGVEIGSGLGQWAQKVNDGNMMVCLGNKLTLIRMITLRIMLFIPQELQYISRTGTR